MNQDQALSDKIDDLCEEGDALASEEEFQEALGRYREAWDLLPEPKDQWDAATWILAAIGDTHFFLKEHQSALSAMTRALRCPGGAGNPFVHLRLGQCHLETGNLEGAKAELTKAFEEGGEEIFEDEDPKYVALLRSSFKRP